MTDFEARTLRVEILLEAYAALMAEVLRCGDAAVSAEAEKIHGELLRRRSERQISSAEENFKIARSRLPCASETKADSVHSGAEIFAEGSAAFEAAVKLLFRHYREGCPCDARAVMIAGQPGAGKTALAMRAAAETGAAFINTDEYRAFHPCYEDAGEDREKKTARFAGAVTERLIDALSDERRNLIIEGTLRTTEVPRTTCGKLKEKGYDVELHVLLATPEESFAHTEARYERMQTLGMHPRRTEKAHHDLVVRQLPGNLSRLYEENCFDAIRLFRRGEDELEEIYSSKVTPEENPAELAMKILGSE